MPDHPDPKGKPSTPITRRPAPDIGALTLVTGAEALREARALPPGVAMVLELTGPRPYVDGPLCGVPQRRVALAAVCRGCRPQLLRYDYERLGLSAYLCLCLAVFVRAGDLPEVSTGRWSALVSDVAVAGVAEEAERTGPHGGGN